ncbi:MAG: hypothetical protein NVS9B10_18720 [Nevskia sp.]
MNNESRVPATLAAEAVTIILAAIDTIYGQLPVLQTLTAEERASTSRLGDRTIGFEEKSVVYMASNPEFLPGFVLMAEVSKDRALRQQLLRFAAELQALSETVDDTLTIVSHEILDADLAYYNAVRDAAKRGVPAAKAIYDDLAKRFPRVGRPATREPVPPTA